MPTICGTPDWVVAVRVEPSLKGCALASAGMVRTSPRVPAGVDTALVNLGYEQ